MLLSPQRRCNSSPPPRIGANPDGSSDVGERRLSAGDVVVDLDSVDEQGGVVVVHGDHDPTCSRLLEDCDGRGGLKSLVEQRLHEDHDVVKTPPLRWQEHEHQHHALDDNCGDVDAFKSPPRPPPSNYNGVRDGPVSPPPPPSDAGGADYGDAGDDDESSFEAGVVVGGEGEEEEHGTPTSVARLMVATTPPPPPPTTSSSFSSTITSESSGKTFRILAPPPPPPPPLPLPAPSSRSYPAALPFEVIEEEDQGQAHRLNSEPEPDVECSAGRGNVSRTRGRPPTLPPVVVEDHEGQPRSSGPSLASPSSSPGSSGQSQIRPVGVLRSALKRGAEARYSSSAPSASPAASSFSSGVNSSTPHPVMTAARRRRRRDVVVVDTSWDFDSDDGGDDVADVMGTSSTTPAETTPRSPTTKAAHFHGVPPPPSSPVCRRCTPTTERRVRGLWNPHCHCPFTRLNDDVLMHHVFASYLTTTDILNVHLVCRRWRYVASQQPCRRRLDLTDYVKIRFDLHTSKASPSSDDVDPVDLTSNDVLAHLERHAADVETLIIRDVGHRLNAGVAVEGVAPCLAPPGRLRRLELGGYATLTDSHVGLILSAPRLLSNSYGGCTVLRAGGASTGGGGSAGLEVLKLEECPLLTYRTACHVAANCTSTLRVLSLRGNRNVTDEGIGPPLADLMRVTSFATCDGGGGGGRDQRHPGSNSYGMGASSSLPPSTPSTASRVPPRSSSSPSPSLMDLFSPPPPPPPPTPMAPSSPLASSGFLSPSPEISEDVIDDGSCAVVDSADRRGSWGGGCLESLDVSRTRVTAGGLLRAVELRLSRAATAAATSSSTRRCRRGRGRHFVHLSEILAGGTGESWTDDRLVRFCRMIDTSAIRVLDLRCSDPFGAERRRRRRRGGDVSTTITDHGLMQCFAPVPRASASSSGRWKNLERLALSGHGPDLTGVGVAAVLRNAPRLSDLDLGGCTGVGRGMGTTTAEESIRAFADALSRRRGGCGGGGPPAGGVVGLRRLNLWRCFPGRREEEEQRAAQKEVAASRLDGRWNRGDDDSAVVPPEERNTSETGRSTTSEETVGSVTVSGSASGCGCGGEVISALCEGPTCDTLEELDMDDCHFVDGTMVDLLRRRCVRLSDGRGLHLRGTRYHREEQERRRRKGPPPPATP